MQQLGNRSEVAALRGELVPLRVMGEPGSDVFQARSTDGRDVVVRFWRSLNELEVRNALELASRARGVRHPMLASVFGIREHGDGTLSLVSEYVEGRTLDAWVADVGLPPLRMSVDFVRRLALGLDAAVQRGVTHHAVYPGNIFVAEPDTKPQGRIVAKLADLGVARPRQALRFEVAHFLAPEELVARLDRAGLRVPVTASMNVYACGCLLHYLCTGQPPLQSDSLAGLAGLHAAGAIAVPSQVNRDIPEYLERVIAQSLERDPKRRIANPGALAASLSHVESVWRSSGVQKKSRVPPPPPPPAAKRESVSQIPAFDLVLRPRATTEPRSGVVAAAAEPVGRATMRGVPQLFQRPTKQAEAPVEGRTTLVGGFAPDGRPMDRSARAPERAVPASEPSAVSPERSVPPSERSAVSAGPAESASVWAAAVRPRIATAREFPAVSPASAAAASERPAIAPERPVAMSEPAVALERAGSPSDSATEALELPAVPTDRAAVTRGEGAAVAASEGAAEARSADEAVAASERAAKERSAGEAVAMRDRPAMPALTGRGPLAGQQGATAVKPVPPRALGWPFAVPVPAIAAESAAVGPVAAGPELKSEFDAKSETDAKRAPTANLEQGSRLSEGLSRVFGRPPSMFGRSTAGQVATPQTASEARAATQPNARTVAPAEPVRQQPSRFPSLRELIAQKTAKREVESTAAAAKLSAATLDPVSISTVDPLQPSAASLDEAHQPASLTVEPSATNSSLTSPSQAVETPAVVTASEVVTANSVEQLSTVDGPSAVELFVANAMADSVALVASTSRSEVAPTSELTSTCESETSNGSVSPSSVELESTTDVSSTVELSDTAASADSSELVAAPSIEVVSANEVAPAGEAELTRQDAAHAAVSTPAVSVATTDVVVEVVSGHAFSDASTIAETDEALATTDVHPSRSDSADVESAAIGSADVDRLSPPARRRFDSTARYGRDLIVPLVDTGVSSEEPDSDHSFFDPHETTTAVGGAFFIPPAAAPAPRSASVPPPLPVWNAPDSSASIVVHPAPLARRARAELVTPVVTPRDSLSPYEVSPREGSVSPREDFVFRSFDPRRRTTRRWPWIAAAGVGLGAYVSLLALQNDPPVHQSTSRPNTEHAIEIMRAEGQAFPITTDWQPALEPPLELASKSDPEPVSQPPERVRAHSDSTEPSKPSRASLRKADQLLDGMQASREAVGVQSRAATRQPAREPAIVNVPSAVVPAVVQGRVPVAPKPVVFGELWATPSVVQAADLRPTTTRPAKVAQPSPQARIVDLPPSAAARTENLEVRGSLSDHTVRRAIDRIRPQLNQCFAEHGAGTGAATSARVELTIDETGRTRDARVKGASGALDECLVQASRKLVAGAPDTGTVKVAWNVRYGR